MATNVQHRRKSKSNPSTGPAFVTAAETAFTHVRNVMTRLIAAMPESAAITRAVHLQRALDTDASLAWRVFKIASSTDPFEVVDYFPAMGQIDTLVEALQKKGVPDNIIADVQAAAAKYAELLHTYAGNRDSLMMMVNSLRPNKGNLVDEKCRKAAFQQNTLVWGRQLDLQLSCCIMLPNRGSDRVTQAVVAGMVGFHEVRPDRGPKFKMQPVFYDPKSGTDQRFLNVVPDHQLLSDFCSASLDVQFRQEDAENVNIYVKLPDLGRQAAIDYFQLFTSTGEHDFSNARLVTSISYPTVVLHQDLLLPASRVARSINACVYESTYESEKKTVEQLGPEDIMPIEISPAYLGAYSDVPPALGIPQYSEMMRVVLNHLGLEGQQFDIYRSRLTYPVMHTRISLGAIS